MPRRMPYHIGIDIGGTFTDTFVTDGSGGWRGKAPTTPAALVDGLIASLDTAAAEAGRPLGEILAATERFAVGTTAVTNTLAQLSGARTGVILTRGFRDLLVMARGHRRGADGMSLPLPDLVARTAVEEVRGRIDQRGEVIEPLDEADVLRAVRRLVEEERIEALAVCLLWSFQNPNHEARVRALARRAFPDLFVTCSAEVFPVIREYERLMTAVLNAYTWRSFSAFVDALEGALRRRGLAAPITVMQSNGGTLSCAEARAKPVFLAQSGPVAGVAAACALAARMGYGDVITGDMGGTSFDVSVVVGGEPLRRVRAELFGFWTGMVMVDVSSIGAGGGSIAWLDEREMLRVGPRSAGADPGPACYGKGGGAPTITDALVVLGLIDPAYFLGGRIALDGEAAAAALGRVAGPLGLGVTAAAVGVYRLALEQMLGAIKALLVEKGLDPRRFTLLSYGGCAALFTAAIARELGIPRVVVPRLASVFSATGAATADVRRDLSRTCFRAMPVPPGVLRDVFEALGEDVRLALATEGVPPARIEIVHEADLRFRKQQWEVTVPVPAEPITADTVRRLERDFLLRYEALYGRGTALAAAGIDLVNCRAVGIGRLPELTAAAPSGASGPGGRPRAKGRRRLVALDGGAGAPAAGAATELFVEVWDGEAVGAGMTVDGPALVERRDTTIYVPPGMRAATDAEASWVIARG
jgi:N-methylhydantoinase A